MRALPWMLGTLVVAVGGYLAFTVLQQRSAGPLPVAPAVPAATVPQGHVYTGLADKPDPLNPFTVTSSAGRRYVLGFTHETLLDSDPQTLALRPVLAQSWQQSADGLDIRLQLRPGVRFADGAPCTPDDVLFTWQVCAAHKALLGSMVQNMLLVQSAELLPGEPATLHLRLREPHFAALRAVGEAWIVVQRAYFERRVAELARAEGQPAPAVGEPAFGRWLQGMHLESGPGTGPYMLAPDAVGESRWDGGSDLRLVPNPRSWRKAAHPDCWNFAGVHLIFPQDATAPGLLFQQGALDWFPDLDGIAAKVAAEPRLQRDYRRIVYDNPLNGPVLMHWNLKRLPDPRVRRALGMLFDRQTAVEHYFRGDAVAAAAYFRPGSDCCPPDLQPLPFDPPSAARLLREAGVGGDSPLRLQIDVPAGPAAAPLRQIVDSFADAARGIGVEVAAHEMEPKALVALQGRGDWDGCLLRRDLLTFADPYDLFAGDGALNMMGFRDAEADRLLAAARLELDDRQRQQLFQQWCRRVAELQPVAFLLFQRSALWMNSHLQNLQPGPLGLWAERLWVPPEFQRR